MSEVLPTLLRASAARQPEAPAILAAPVWTYRALDRASDCVAAGLASRGVAPGDRVALYCPNGADFVLAYLGILKAGAVVVPVNLLLNPAAIAFILADGGVTALCLHADLATPAAAAMAAAPGLRLRVGIGFAADAAATDLVDVQIETLLAPASTAIEPPAAPGDPGADAVILYTSGTTGRPKGAVLTHANLASNAVAVARVLGFRPGQERVLVVLPMFHAFAGTVGILAPLLAGAALIPVGRFDPALISQAVANHQATIFLGVPSLYTVLLRLSDAQVQGWRTVRLCISGGAALPAAVMSAFEQRFGVPILEGDGPTECGPVTCVNPPAGPRKPGSVGPALPGVEMRIAAPDGSPLADGEHGEVCVRGPSVMRGYWNLPTETAAAFHGDWFRTGDLGWRDADGWFYLVDRIKDLIISNGMNVYPRIIEEVLVQHPAVAEAAVVGEAHRVHGEIPIAYVTAAGAATPDPAALRAWCRERLGRHEVPRRIEVLAALPRNAAGKVLKRELRRGGEVERGVPGP
ncbi:MAG: long-chain fatty acid--CoA ligase [Chromatiaceae bacterium]|nr:MAG: long-chain fatty acid--CoA ligase [Chromatiaceae bacterium]